MTSIKHVAQKYLTSKEKNKKVGKFWEIICLKGHHLSWKMKIKAISKIVLDF